METSCHGADRGPGRFVVKRASNDDLPEAAAVQAVCFREIGAGVVPDEILADVTGPRTVHSTIEQWADLLEDGAEIWILEDRLDMRTVGVVMAKVSNSPDAPTPWEVATMHVLPEARTCGASDELLTRAIGDKPAFMWVFRDNARAISFYRRHGFEVDPSEDARDDSLGGIELQRLVRPAPEGQQD